MKKTGEVLRKAREEKGLSLHEVGIFLKINTRILQAIENGDLEKLPAKTFLRGFVQSYAKYLKLNNDEVLALFQSELKPQHDEAVIEADVTTSNPENNSLDQNQNTEKVEVEPESTSINRSSNQQSVLMGPGLTTDTLKLKTIVISALALVLVFVVYFGNHLIRRYQKEAEIPDEISGLTQEPQVINPQSTTQITTDPVAVDPAQVTPTTPTPTLAPTDSNSSPVIAPMTPAPTAVNTVPTTTPSPATPTAVTAPTQPTPPTPPATQQKTANETTSLPTAPAATNSTTGAKPVEGKSVEVIIEAKDNVEIEYASAKSNPQKLLLKGDQIHTFKSRSGIRLKISNGGAVNIIVNGQDLGVPGATGQSVQLSYE